MTTTLKSINYISHHIATTFFVCGESTRDLLSGNFQHRIQYH